MKYAEIGKRIGELVEVKNSQYGSSFAKSGEFLKILYPDGIKTEQYDDVLLLARMFDKMMRIANGNQGDENAYGDINGYSLLGYELHEGKAKEINTAEITARSLKKAFRSNGDESNEN